MEELKKWIEEAKNIVFFTGAGISTVISSIIQPIL